MNQLNLSNPAALAAALRGDLANALIASTPGGIARQEAAGQATLVATDVIPKEIHGATHEQLTAMGFVFGAEADELFVHCQLPAGWRKQATDHSMNSDLVDDKGRKRANIFYKAAFYDRNADMSMNGRFRVNAYRDGSTKEMYRVDVLDGETVIKEFGEYECRNYAAGGLLETQARAWLDEKYSDWKNPLAYWAD